MTYTPGMIRKLLSDYQRRAQGARMRAPEDRLGTRPPPLDEAPWANTSCLWSDLEQAMRALPFQHEKILWEVVCKGESSSRNGTKRYNWRAQVADWWNITPGDVNKIVDESLQMMCVFLNGAEFVDGENAAETINEHDPQLLPDLIENSLNGVAVTNG